MLLATAGCALPRIIILDDPLSPREHLELGLAYEKQGRPDLALKEYRAAAPELPLAWHLMGNVQYQLGDYKAAQEAYRTAIRTMPGHPDPYNNLAWLLYATNQDLDEAEALARRAVALAEPEKQASYRDTLDRIIKLRTDLKKE
ncbi:MAG: tetratricopeptide repeat protein [Thermodesulfobacteriota bacterium]